MQQAAFPERCLHQLSVFFYSGGLSQENHASNKTRLTSLSWHCTDKGQLGIHVFYKWFRLGESVTSPKSLTQY